MLRKRFADHLFGDEERRCCWLEPLIVSKVVRYAIKTTFTVFLFLGELEASVCSTFHVISIFLSYFAQLEHIVIQRLLK